MALAITINGDGLTAICAHQDATFVITSGGKGDDSAVEIAKEAMTDHDGGAGGSKVFAQGGDSDVAICQGVTAACAILGCGEPIVVSLGDHRR